MLDAHISEGRLVDTTALRSFREVYRQGSISAAAQALGYTQSAISRQIAGLETRFGAPLLERHARGVRLTAAGDALLDHAAVILRRIDWAERDITASRNRPVIRLRVGAVPSAAGLVSDALSRSATGVPAVRTTFAEDFTPRLLPRIQAGELDVAVVTDFPPGIPAQPDLVITHLLDDAVVCVVAGTHPRAGQGVVDLADLAEEAWVEDYVGAAGVLSRACARAGFTPRIDIECGSWLGKQAFVAAGHGIMLAPWLLVPTLRPDLAILTLATPVHRQVYAVAHRRRTASSPAAEAFVRALVEAAGAATDGP